MKILSLDKYLKKSASTTDKAIEKVLPKKAGKKWLEQIVGKTRFQLDSKAINNSVSKPIWDFLKRGGKRWRPALMLLSIGAVGGKPSKFREFTAIPELIHTGTIIVDDVEDNSTMRRGKPCLHCLYGTDLAINDGNLLYFLPLSLVYKNSKIPNKTKASIYDFYAEELMKLSLGQALDIYWHQGHAKKVTESQYMQMCEFKTGTLARFSAKLGALLGGGRERQITALGNFAAMIGVGFQIQDDILNIAPSKGWGKEIGDDISEGKRTLLVLHTLKKAGPRDRKRLLKILDMQTKNRKLVKEAIALIKKYGSIDYAKKKAKKLVKDSWEELDSVLKESSYKKRLKEFADFLIDREI